MAKLLFYFFLLGLLSCAIGNKFSGTYATNQHITGLDEQIIHFTSDSTLQYISMGRHTDTLSGVYIVTTGYILIKFKCDELHKKWESPADSMSVLNTFQFYSKDSIFCQFYLTRAPNYAMGNFHGFLIAESNSSYARNDYLYFKSKKGSYWYKYIHFKKKT
jgi:hypothetical protein